MFDCLFKSSLWQVIVLSDWISKYIILLGLMILSIFCIAIFIFKYIMFRFQRKQMILILKKIASVKTLSEVSLITKEFGDSVGGIFFSQALHKFDEIIAEKVIKSVDTHDNARIKDQSLSVHEVDYLEVMLIQEIDALLLTEEEYLPILGTSAAIGPLIGLFGTIWGLIHSFISMGQDKSTEIATVAPGIASALVTTLVGLIVAIPAMIAFHYFSNNLRKIELQLNQLMDIFMYLVKKNFTK